MIETSSVARMARVCAAIILILACVAALARSTTATIAHKMFFDIRHGADKGGELPLIATKASRSSALYPENYHLCRLLASRSFADGAAQTGSERSSLWAQAEIWTDRGLALNPYDRTLKLQRLGLLEAEDRNLAILFWEDHTRWQYWDPYNHHVLALLYARNRQIAEAEGSFELIAASRYRDATRMAIDQAKLVYGIHETIKP